MQSSDHTNPKLSFNVEEREGKRPRVDVDPFFEASASTVLDPTHRPDRLQLPSRLSLSLSFPSLSATSRFPWNWEFLQPFQLFTSTHLCPLSLPFHSHSDGRSSTRSAIYQQFDLTPPYLFQCDFNPFSRFFSSPPRSTTSQSPPFDLCRRLEPRRTQPFAGYGRSE